MKLSSQKSPMIQQTLSVESCILEQSANKEKTTARAN